MSGDGTVSGSISAEEMIDPAALRQEQVLGRFDAQAKGLTMLADGINELGIRLDALLEAKEDTIRFRKVMLEENAKNWNAFMAALDGLNAGIARELGEQRKQRKCINVLKDFVVQALQPPSKRAAKRRRKP